MKRIRKFISLMIIVSLMVIPHSIPAQATSPDAGHHEITTDCCEPHTLKADEQPQNDVSPQNVWCAILGHNVPNTWLIYLYASMVNFTTCRLHYNQQGYCTRCSELVTYGVYAETAHDIVYEADGEYCYRNCGYELLYAK